MSLSFSNSAYSDSNNARVCLTTLPNQTGNAYLNISPSAGFAYRSYLNTSVNYNSASLIFSDLSNVVTATFGLISSNLSLNINGTVVATASMTSFVANSNDEIGVRKDPSFINVQVNNVDLITYTLPNDIDFDEGQFTITGTSGTLGSTGYVSSIALIPITTIVDPLAINNTVYAQALICSNITSPQLIFNSNAAVFGSNLASAVNYGSNASYFSSNLVNSVTYSSNAGTYASNSITSNIPQNLTVTTITTSNLYFQNLITTSASNPFIAFDYLSPLSNYNGQQLPTQNLFSNVFQFTPPQYVTPCSNPSLFTFASTGFTLTSKFSSSNVSGNLFTLGNAGTLDSLSIYKTSSNALEIDVYNSNLIAYTSNFPIGTGTNVLSFLYSTSNTQVFLNASNIIVSASNNFQDRVRSNISIGSNWNGNISLVETWNYPVPITEIIREHQQLLSPVANYVFADSTMLPMFVINDSNVLNIAPLNQVGNASFMSNLSVFSNLSVNQNVVVSNSWSNLGNASFTSNVFVGGIESNLGNASFASNVVVGQILTAIGNASFSSNVVVGGLLSNLGFTNLSNLALATSNTTYTMSNAYINESNIINASFAAISNSYVSESNILNPQIVATSNAAFSVSNFAYSSPSGFVLSSNTTTTGCNVVVRGELFLGTSSDSNNNRMISALNSNLLTTNYITVGQSASANNQAEISFTYVSSNSPSNTLGLGLFGGATIVTSAAQTSITSTKVGIGTTTPFCTLDVNGTTRIIGGAFSSQSNPPDSLSALNNLLLTNPSKTGTSPYAMAMGVDNTTGYGYINCAGNSAAQPLLLNSRGGGVGVNNSNPQYTLDVNGSINTNSNLTVTGTTTVGVINSTSLATFNTLAVTNIIAGLTTFNQLTVTSNVNLGTLTVSGSSYALQVTNGAKIGGTLGVGNTAIYPSSSGGDTYINGTSGATTHFTNGGGSDLMFIASGGVWVPTLFCSYLNGYNQTQTYDDTIYLGSNLGYNANMFIDRATTGSLIYGYNTPKNSNVSTTQFYNNSTDHTMLLFLQGRGSVTNTSTSCNCVGILTNSPAVAFDVNGATRIIGTSAVLASSPPDGGGLYGYNLFLTNPAKTGSSPYTMGLGVDYTSGYGVINCAGNGAQQPLLLNSRGGNVGINTSNPAYALDVNGTINASGACLYGNAGVCYYANSNFSGSTSSFALAQNNAGTTYLNCALNYAINIQNGAASQIANFTANSIGMFQPLTVTGALTCSNNARITGYLQMGNSTDTSRLISALNSGMSGTAYVAFGQSASSFNQTELSFNYVGSNSVANTAGIGLFGGQYITTCAAQTIISSSGVGIGRTPVYSLDVQGQTRITSSTSSGQLILQGASSYTAQMYFYPNGQTSTFTALYAAATTFYVQNTTNGVYLAQGGTSWGSASDLNLKKNIVKVNQLETLGNVLRLSPVKFHYHTDDENVTPLRTGLIAQHVQKIFPEMISENDGKLGMSYTELIPHLVSCIKEQQKQIEVMKKQIETMKYALKEAARKNDEQDEKLITQSQKIARILAYLNI